MDRISFLIISFLFVTVVGCGGNSGNTNNGGSSIEIKLSQNPMTCSQSCIASIDLITSDNYGRDVTITIEKTRTAEIVYNPGAQYFAAGENAFFTILCNQTYTAPDTYEINASFVDGGTTFSHSMTLSITSYGITTLDATYEFDYMDETYYSGYSDDMRESAYDTYKVTNFKVNLYNTPVNETSTSVDFEWDKRLYLTFYSWFTSPSGFQNFIDNNRLPQYPPKYYVVTARKYTEIDNNSNEDIEADGMSGNTNVSGGRNYSFLFMKNIDLKLPRDPNVESFSYRNLVMNHELLHQLGGIGTSGHSDHTSGEKYYSCALNQAATIQQHAASWLYSLTATWPVCDKHISECRIGIQNLDNMEIPFVNKESASNKRQDNDILEVSLSKNNYKLFEPIEVLCKYINTGKEKDSIYDMFRDELDKVKFYIKDSNGRIFNSKYAIHPFYGFLRKPSYIVDPGDTLFAVMHFNFYGITTENVDSSYFGYNGYFPVGNYEGYAYVEDDYNKIYKPSLKSNSIYFRIEELSYEDIETLRKYRVNRLDEIISTENNVFSEYFNREKIRQTLAEVINGEIKTDKLLQMYLDFISEYPNSYFNIFYCQRYLMEKAKNTNSLNTEIKKLIDAFPNTIVSQFLSNNSMNQYIIGNFKAKQNKNQQR